MKNMNFFDKLKMQLQLTEREQCAKSRMMNKHLFLPLKHSNKHPEIAFTNAFYEIESNTYGLNGQSVFENGVFSGLVVKSFLQRSRFGILYIDPGTIKEDGSHVLHAKYDVLRSNIHEMVSNTKTYEMHLPSLVKACRMSMHLWDELVASYDKTRVFSANQIEKKESLDSPAGAEPNPKHRDRSPSATSRFDTSLDKSPCKKKAKEGGDSPDKRRISRRLAKTKKEVSPLKPKAPAQKRGRPSTRKTPASKSKDAGKDDSDDDSDDESDDESDDVNMIPKEAADALVEQAVQEAVQKNTALLLKKQAAEYEEIKNTG